MKIKNNIKYILILAIGFFWCSSVYLTQEQYLVNLVSVDYVNIVELLFGSIAMGLGIILFGILYHFKRNIKLYYALFMIIALASTIVFFFTKSNTIMCLCMCLTCLFGTAGFGAGLHFALLSKNVLKEHRGRVFAIGYGLGSIGTYLLILLPESFYATKVSLALYIPIILINLFIVLKYTNQLPTKNEKWTPNFRSSFVKISIIVLLMSLLSALSTDTIAFYTIDIPGGYGGTRLYYCLGLLLAGYLVDKHKRVFDLLVIISFIFSLLAIILLKDSYSINIVAALSYSFVAFFVLFRTISFVNLVDGSKSAIGISAFGLMYSRFVEGLLVLFEDKLINHYLLLIIIMFITLAVLLLVFFLMYYQTDKTNQDDVVKKLAIDYQLSAQEEKVLKLLIDNHNSNQMIADQLYISVYTVKRHIANIYKKTGMNKKELIGKCFK